MLAVTYTGTIEPANNNYLLGGGGGTLTIANALNDAGGQTALTVNAPGMVVLSASPTYTGNTTVNTGAVLDLGGNTLTTASTVTVNGGLQDGIVVSTAQDYAIQSGLVSANLGGGVNLTKTTTATATLAGANSYAGVTNVNGGVLNLGSAGASRRPARSPSAAARCSSLWPIPSTTPARSTTDSAAIAIDPNGQHVTFAAALDSSNLNGLTLNGTGGTLTLPVSEQFGGTTTVNGSFLALTGGNNILPTTGNIVVAGGTLDLGGNGQTTSGQVSFQGGVTQNGTITDTATDYDGRAARSRPLFKAT